MLWRFSVGSELGPNTILGVKLGHYRFGAVLQENNPQD